MELHVNRMYDIINEYLKTSEFQLVFSSFIAKDEKETKEKDEKFFTSFKEFWNSIDSSFQGDDKELLAFKCRILGKFVERIQEQANPSKIRIMFGLVKKMIDDNVVKPRMLCEAILKSTKLSFRNESSWCQSFELIANLLLSIDYKGCRDIFTLVLEKAKDISQLIPQPASLQIEGILKVLRLILDRNLSLLPAYFCINEILKIYPEGKMTPHWAISKLLADFVDGFRPLAHLVTISGRSQLYPIIGSPCSSLHAANSHIWKLDHKQLTFIFKVQLPYDKSVSGRQYELLRYIVSQQHSRETVHTILGLSKGKQERCPVLEEVIVDLIMDTLDKCEIETNFQNMRLLWQQLSGLVISYVLFNLVNFSNIVTSLHQKVLEMNLFKGRDFLMWFILQLCSTGNTEFKDFVPLIKLIELLYPEQKPLKVPDGNSASYVFSLAVACLWNFISSKAQAQGITLKPLRSLTNHIIHLETVYKLCQESSPSLARIDNNTALLMNAYPVVQTFSHVTDLWFGKIGGPNQASHSKPIPLALLDMVTYPAKMNLIMYIGKNRIGTNYTAIFSPALLETYSRLVMDNDIPGIRNVLANVLPNVFKIKAWGILHNLLEMFSYRLHYIPQNYRITLFSHIHSLTGVPHTNQNQLHVGLESTAFRLIHGLDNHIVETHFTKHEANLLVSSESEELNRIFVLTIARAMHISGTEQHSSQWYETIFKVMVEKTPMNWSKHTLEHFPLPLQQFFTQHSVALESKAALKQRVDEEYLKFKNMKSQSEILTYFGEPSSPNIFVCVIYCFLLETGRLNQICLAVLEKLGARALSNQVRVFADFLVQDYSFSSKNNDHTKRINCVHDMVWTYHITTIDRLVLCLTLRYYEEKEAQVCNLLITFLLLKNPTFRDRIHSFVKEVPSDYWHQNDWHQKHQAYDAKWPEKFYFEGLREATKANSHNVAYLPVNFGNVCLRFLPVLDVIIHRIIELPPVGSSLESLLLNFGSLYKFHDRPITYLYNTLHYYNRSLVQRQTTKKRLVCYIIGAFNNIHPPNWSVSQAFLTYLNGEDKTEWKPDIEYYCGLIGRLVDNILPYFLEHLLPKNNSMSGKSPFPAFDWRFNEFLNASAHALHVTCVELMALPVSNEEIGQGLFSVVYKCGETTRALDIMNNIQPWINAVALVMTSLPESFGKIVHHMIREVLANDLLMKDVTPAGNSFTYDDSVPFAFPYSFYCFKSNAAACSLTFPDLVIAFSNAIWYHSSLGQLSLIPVLLRDTLKPLVQNEAQFLFICRLLGPFLIRFYIEKPRCLLEITKELYCLLSIIDNRCQYLYHVNTICDFFYHIKYMFVGDSIKNDIQQYLVNLRPVLKNRLQFISHTGQTKEDSTSVS